jgi:hypothetical protein
VRKLISRRRTAAKASADCRIPAAVVRFERIGLSSFPGPSVSVCCDALTTMMSRSIVWTIPQQGCRALAAGINRIPPRFFQPAESSLHHCPITFRVAPIGFDQSDRLATPEPPADFILRHPLRSALRPQTVLATELRFGSGTRRASHPQRNGFHSLAVCFDQPGIVLSSRLDLRPPLIRQSLHFFRDIS